MDPSRDISCSFSTFLSDHTMSPTNLVMACRFGWAAGPARPSGSQQSALPTSATSTISPANSSQQFQPKRACHGNLYHQLECGHRVRTDLVEDCGTNCLEPQPNAPFYCDECIEAEATLIWRQRETEHKSSYPTVGLMSNEQYNRWYDEHRQLEAHFEADRRAYEADLRTKTRPSNRCMDLEMTKEENDFTTKLDSLTLQMSGVQDDTGAQVSIREARVSLPGDASEQLHWALGQLDLERGSCAVEASSSQKNVVSRQQVHVGDDEEL